MGKTKKKKQTKQTNKTIATCKPEPQRDHGTHRLRGVAKYCTCKKIYTVGKLTQRCKVGTPYAKANANIAALLNCEERNVAGIGFCGSRKLVKRPKTKIKTLRKAATSALLNAIETADMEDENIYKMAANQTGENVKRFLTKKYRNELNKRQIKNKTSAINEGVRAITSRKVAIKKTEKKCGITKNQKYKGNSQPVKSNDLNRLKLRKKSRVPSIKKMLNSAFESAMKTPTQLISFYKIKQFCFQNYGLNIEQINENKSIIREYLKERVEKGEIIRLSGSGLVGSFILYKKTKRPRKVNARKPIKFDKVVIAK